MVKAKLLDVVSDLRKLADSLQAAADAIAGSETATVQPVQSIATKETAPDVKAVTLEQVRMVLAEKSQDGFTADVRALLEKHGAKKLSEIDPANYAALLADAERLK